MLLFVQNAWFRGEYGKFIVNIFFRQRSVRGQGQTKTNGPVRCPSCGSEHKSAWSGDARQRPSVKTKNGISTTVGFQRENKHGIWNISCKQTACFLFFFQKVLVSVGFRGGAEAPPRSLCCAHSYEARARKRNVYRFLNKHHISCNKWV